MARQADRGSFTGRVLAEVAPHVPPLQCCRHALVDGARLCSAPEALEREPRLVATTTRAVTARAVLQTLGALGAVAHVERVRAARRARFAVVGETAWEEGHRSARACCARSLLRGGFLGGGLVSAPGRPPQLELACRSEAAAEELRWAAARLDVPLTVLRRRGRSLAVARAAPAVAALLSSIGAQAARLDFEEARVESEVRGGVNRRTNAETANLRRTAAAAVGQASAVLSLAADPERWRALPPALREAAELRRRHQADTLQQLAERAGVSRAAMAGRLHRLVQLAAEPR